MQHPPDYERRFGGMARLFGSAGAARIANSHVMVIGIGGVGSWAAECLARSGVGRITLVDMDHVAESNINRQIQASDASLGMAKIVAMQAHILGYHPQCQVQLIDDFVTPENWASVYAQAAQVQRIDAVIDCCDQVKTKTALAAWAQKSGMGKRGAFISVGAAGGKKLAQLVEVADLSEVTHDPLLAQVRYRLRRSAREAAGASQPEGSATKHKNKKMGISCVFSREAVEQPQADQAQADAASCETSTGNAELQAHNLSCAGYGSFVGVTATFGMVASSAILGGLAQ